MTDQTVIVFLGGDRDSSARDVLRRRLDSLVGDSPTLVIAADGGLRRSASWGTSADHVIGDLDSIDEESLRSAEASGAVIHRHQRDKDATDSELAIRLAATVAGVAPTPRAQGANARRTGSGRARLIVIGGTDGRLDHLFADLLLIGSAATEGFEVIAIFGTTTVQIARPRQPVVIEGRTGDAVSLLPLNGDASGIETLGLRWPLVNATLRAGTTRGMSNELSAEGASISVAAGALAVIRTGEPAGQVEDRTGGYDPTPLD